MYKSAIYGSVRKNHSSLTTKNIVMSVLNSIKEKQCLALLSFYEYVQAIFSSGWDVPTIQKNQGKYETYQKAKKNVVAFEKEKQSLEATGAGDWIILQKDYAHKVFGLMGCVIFRNLSEYGTTVGNSPPDMERIIKHNDFWKTVLRGLSFILVVALGWVFIATGINPLVTCVVGLILIAALLAFLGKYFTSKTAREIETWKNTTSQKNIVDQVFPDGFDYAHMPLFDWGKLLVKVSFPPTLEIERKDGVLFPENELVQNHKVIFVAHKLSFGLSVNNIFTYALTESKNNDVLVAIETENSIIISGSNSDWGKSSMMNSIISGISPLVARDFFV